jgi:hypothetical protein
VEDDQAVRRLICRMLVGAEFEVLSAADGEEALALAADGGQPIDVLVTDVSMPKLGGLELAERMRALRPEIQVLLVTGSQEEGRSIPGAAVLRKPFTSRQLIEALGRLLE